MGSADQGKNNSLPPYGAEVAKDLQQSGQQFPTLRSIAPMQKF